MAIIESGVVSKRTTEYEGPGGTAVVTSRLDSYLLRALPQDLLTVLRGVALQELDQQIGAGNPPTQILVDGRAVQRRGVLEATRSVSMRFMDVSMLIDAVKEVFRVLRRVTRVQVPPKNSVVARQHFWLYVNGQPQGLLPGAFAKLDPARMRPTDVLRVVGPLVPYGRKLYWRPVGRDQAMSLKQTVSLSGRSIYHYGTKYDPQFKPYRMRTIRKVANAMPGADKAANLRNLLASRPGHVEGAGQIVKRVMRGDRRFKGIYFSDGWVRYPPAGSWGKNSKDDRVPSVSVQLSKKGSTVSSLSGKL